MGISRSFSAMLTSTVAVASYDLKTLEGHVTIIRFYIAHMLSMTKCYSSFAIHDSELANTLLSSLVYLRRYVLKCMALSM
jgi:hypothetical protein